MAEGKSLKFSFVLDDQSFARVKRALGELTTQAQVLAKTLQGVNVGGGGTGSGTGALSGGSVGGTSSASQTQSRNFGRNQAKGGITASILGNVEAFQKLAKSGKDGMAMMTESIRKGVADQVRDIDRLDRRMATLKDRIRDTLANRDVLQYKMGIDVDKRVGGLTDQLLQRQNARDEALSRKSSLEGMDPSRGFMSKTLSGLNQGWKENGLAMDLTNGHGVAGMGKEAFGALLGPSVGAMIARSIGIAVAGAIKIGQTSVASDRMGIDLIAKEGRSWSPYIQQAKSGDTRHLDAMTAMRGDKGVMEQALVSVFGKDAQIMRRFDAAKQAAGGLDFTGQQFTDMFQSAEERDKLTEVLDAAGQSREAQLGIGRGREYAASTRADRGVANRMFGRGFYTDKNGKLNNNFSKWSNDLYGKGYSVAEAASAAQSSRMGVGSDALTGQIMAANATGWGAYGHVLASAARAGNKGMAGLAIGGGINRAAGIQLGNAILGSGYDPRGNVDKSAVFGAFQGGYKSMLGKGTDPASHFNAANQFVAGLGAGNAVVSGQTSGYQTGMNILNAIGAMPGGSAYAQDFLATGMTYEQMIAGSQGKLTDGARLRGISSDMIKNQLAGSSKAALSMWVDEGAMDPVSQAMRKYQASGMSPMEFLQQKGISVDEKKALGLAFGQVTGQGDEAGIGWALGQAGIGTAGKAGAGPGFKMDKMEQSDRAKEIAVLEASQSAFEIGFTSLLVANETHAAYSRATAENTAAMLRVLIGMHTGEKDYNKVSGIIDSLNRSTTVGSATAIAPGVGPKKHASLQLAYLEQFDATRRIADSAGVSMPFRRSVEKVTPELIEQVQAFQASLKPH